jgi:tetratricopeptide (TPR) repeat protein
MPRVALVAALLLALPTACTAPQRPYPRQLRVRQTFTLDQWSRLESRGFAIYTNASEGRARQLVERLSLFIDLVHEVMGPRHLQPGPDRTVFLFARRSQFAWLGGGGGAIGHAVPAFDGITVGAAVGEQGVPTLLHELAHVAQLEDPAIAYPSWYMEGMAELLSSAGFREGVVTLGALPRGRSAVLEASEPLPLERILDTPNPRSLDAEDVVRFYVDSWVLVRLLHGGLGSGFPNHHAELVDFLRALGAGTPWRQAYDQSFTVPLEVLDQEFRRLRALVASGAAPVRRLSLEPSPLSLDFQAIGEVEAALALGDYAARTGRAALAVAFYDDVLAVDANRISARLDRAIALAALGRLDEAEADLAAIPADQRQAPDVLEAEGDVALARYWTRRAEDEPPAEETRLLFREAVSKYRQAAAADGQRASAWASLADAHAWAPDGDPAEGLAALDRADALLPAALRGQLVRGALLTHLGRREEALVILMRLRGGLHREEDAKRVEELLASLGVGESPEAAPVDQRDDLFQR